MAGSGTRFEVILPLWQKFLTLAKTLELLFSNLQHFEPTLANFYALGQFYIAVNGQNLRNRDSRTSPICDRLLRICAVCESHPALILMGLNGSSR